MPPDVDASLVRTPFLKYQVVTVVGAGHPLAHGRVSLDQLRDQTWLLGPAAAAEVGVVPQMLRRLRVPEDHQRIFQSGAAALEETQRGSGVSLAPSFVVAQDVAEGRLVKLAGPGLQADGVWSALTMPEQAAGRRWPSSRASSARRAPPRRCCVAPGSTSATSSRRCTSRSGADGVSRLGIRMARRRRGTAR